MSNNRSLSKLLTWLWLLLVTLCFNELSAESLLLTLTSPPDTLIVTSDTLVRPDTIREINQGGDTLVKIIKEHTVVDTEVFRDAVDSIVQDLINKKVVLYGDAEIKYQDIVLKAAVIEVDFNTNTVYASGREDSSGKIIGAPEFTEGNTTFKAKTMTYNFTSKKGIINGVITEDDQGFLHGEKVKKMEDNTINVLRGSYTTCNLEENPHFSFKFKKARVIPDNKIVTGPAYMEIEGMPTVLALPFGIFPNKSTQKSGILIPSYGESRTRGFFLENGGYYWAINDYMDLQVLGDIYTHGSWAIKPTYRYKKRYKFGGEIGFGYAINVVSTKGSPDYSKSTDFRIRWNHRQDPKARPRSNFSADVNIVTSNYVKYNVVSVEDYLSNEFQSSIAYQTNWAGKYFLTVNGKFRQNTKTNQVDLTLPELTFSVNRFYPLRKPGGKKRFYEDLSITYSVNAKNQISAADSILYSGNDLGKLMQNGAIHKVPINLPLKVLKYFTLSNSINITDRMYSQSVTQFYQTDTAFVENDTILPGLKTDTIAGFRNTLDFSFSSSLNTTVYGILRFKKGPIRAIRHVFRPSVGFSYVPDFGKTSWGYSDSYIDETGREVIYSQISNPQYSALYGAPPGQQSGAITYNFSNNLEIKVRSKKDTITGMKKVVLIENLSFSGNYDLAKDSLNLSYLNINGRTTLWKNLKLQYSSIWDPYILDSAGKRMNTFEWTENRRFFRMKSTAWNLSIGFQLSDKDFSKKEKPKEVSEDEWTQIEQNPDGFVDWNVPWSLSFNYTFQYLLAERLNFGERTVNDEIVQTLGVNGQINITPKWKFTFRTGWDFNNNALSYTSINIYRDLHCWEMRFNWIPIGDRQSWNFSINVKASILQDLKLNRRKDFRDF